MLNDGVTKLVIGSWYMKTQTAQLDPERFEKVLEKLLEAHEAPENVARYLHAHDGHVDELPELLAEIKLRGYDIMLEEGGENVAYRLIEGGAHELHGMSFHSIDWIDFFEKVAKDY